MGSKLPGYFANAGVENKPTSVKSTQQKQVTTDEEKDTGHASATPQGSSRLLLALLFIACFTLLMVLLITILAFGRDCRANEVSSSASATDSVQMKQMNDLVENMTSYQLALIDLKDQINSAFTGLESQMEKTIKEKLDKLVSSLTEVASNLTNTSISLAEYMNELSEFGDCEGPCKNGKIIFPSDKEGTFECVCDPGFYGKVCDKGTTSCKEVYEKHNYTTSRLVTLGFDEKPISVYCHFGDFGCGDGVWTTVMKMDGKKNTFNYDSAYWSNRDEYNIAGGETGFDSQETKLPTYWNTSFNKICLGMKVNQQTRFIAINTTETSSLYSLIADGNYRNTSVGRDTWKTLIGSDASLQLNCNKEGFNAECTSTASSRARIGLLGNENDNCDTCDSRLGFGTTGFPDFSNTCGNEAVYGTDNGDKSIRAMGYILVQ